MKRAVLHLSLFAALCSFAFALSARAEPVEGRDYARLPAAQAPEGNGKVEVIEFFSYACPHCRHFNPVLHDWAARLPANAVLIRVPVSLGRPEWGQLVRAYYTLQATGDLDRLDTALFDAIHNDKQPLFNEANLTAWAAQHGVPAEKFRQTFNSFNVSTRASHAEQMSRDYQVRGVPHLVIDGKYEVLGGDYGQMLNNATQVLSMASKGK